MSDTFAPPGEYKAFSGDVVFKITPEASRELGIERSEIRFENAATLRPFRTRKEMTRMILAV